MPILCRKMVRASCVPNDCVGGAEGSSLKSRHLLEFRRMPDHLGQTTFDMQKHCVDQIQLLFIICTGKGPRNLNRIWCLFLKDSVK